MSALPGTTLPSTIGPAALGIAWCLFIWRKAHRQYPAFCAYLTFRLGVYGTLILAQLAAARGFIDIYFLATATYYVSLAGCLAGAGIAFFVIQSVFSRLIEPFPGLHRFGMVAFRWATAASVLIALAMAVVPAALRGDVLTDATSAVTRCMSILELCLLAFILFSMQSLRFSPKTRDFGIALGLATIASADLAASALGQSAVAAHYVSRIGVTAAAGVWGVYFCCAATQRLAVKIPESSALYKWNEVASALAEPAPQVALGVSVDPSFLQNVEKAVDKVMERNALHPRS